MKYINPFYLFIAVIFCFCYSRTLAANLRDTTPFSTKEEAIAYLDKQPELNYSKFWPNVPPAAFMQNLRRNVEIPLSIYEGRSTNFCAYAALSYLPLHDNPLGYVTFML
ncbi:MAG: hypothetical protein ABIS69_07080, partial [Sediminibacterium sp.]